MSQSRPVIAFSLDTACRTSSQPLHVNLSQASSAFSQRTSVSAFTFVCSQNQAEKTFGERTLTVMLICFNVLNLCLRKQRPKGHLKVTAKGQKTLFHPALKIAVTVSTETYGKGVSMHLQQKLQTNIKYSLLRKCCFVGYGTTFLSMHLV